MADATHNTRKHGAAAIAMSTKGAAKMRSMNLAAALAAATCLTGFAHHARAATGIDGQPQAACGSGYHADRGGVCQPDVQEVNRYCPQGGVYHPAPNGGWTCETPAAAYSQPLPVSEPEPAFQPERQRAPKPHRVAHTREPRHVATHRITESVAPIQQVRANDAPAQQQTRSISAVQPDMTVPQVSGGGGGGGGGGWSDRRLKRDIVRLGVSPSGLPIYAFQYVWGGPRYIGVMAQDLLKLRPDAVIMDEFGYFKVDYSRIDVEMREEPALAEAL